MDTTETYIKMCEKAEEIQKQKPPISRHINGITCFGDDGNCWDLESGRVIWLPRQDQLQEMVRDSELTDGSFIISDLIYKLHGFYNQKYDDYPISFTSMEQLWLAFVMKEKYGKVWNGEDWVKEEK